MNSMDLTTESFGTHLQARTHAKLGVGGAGLVLASVLFNAALCFVSTVSGVHFSNGTVVVCECLILITGLYLIRSRISEFAVRITIVVVTMMLAMKFLNAGLNLKLLHDVSIAYIFFQLGTLTSVQRGNRLVWITMAIVLALGSFEASMPVEFGKLFNIWSYYVDKGVLTSVVNYGNSTSFISGVRGGQEARSFLPSLLGPQRFSSVFLEPVSMGNFAVIVFAWCLSVRQTVWWKNAILILGAAICAILSDSRFAFVCWFLMLALRCTPLHRSRFVLFCIPVGAMLLLLMVGSLHELPSIRPYIMSDDFPGRLLFSGRLLNYWGWPQWFGLARSPIYVDDTGYAYVINNMGLPLTLGLLGLMVMKVPASREAASMKAMIIVYTATSLCIGANMFTIKTAALAWFLYGAAGVVSTPQRYAATPANAPMAFGSLRRAATGGKDAGEML